MEITFWLLLGIYPLCDLLYLFTWDIGWTIPTFQVESQFGCSWRSFYCILVVIFCWLFLVCVPQKYWPMLLLSFFLVEWYWLCRSLGVLVLFLFSFNNLKRIQKIKSRVEFCCEFIWLWTFWLKTSHYYFNLIIFLWFYLNVLFLLGLILGIWHNLESHLLFNFSKLMKCRL